VIGTVVVSTGTVVVSTGTISVSNIATGTISVSNIATGTISVSNVVSITGTSINVVASGTVQMAHVVEGGYMFAIVTSSAMASSTNLFLMTVYNSTGNTAATSGWTIGSGSVLAVYGLAFGWSQAAANNTATFMLLVTASNSTLSTVATAWAQINYSNAVAISTVLSTGFTPGGVIGINSSVTNMSFPWHIPGPAVVGIAVAITSSGATVYASMLATILGTVEPARPFYGVGGAITVMDVARTNINIFMTSTVLGSVGTTVSFTINQGITQTTAGTTSWVIPAGKTFRLLGAVAIVQNSITTTPVIIRCAVLCSNALPTMVDAAPRLIEVQAMVSTTGLRVANQVFAMMQDMPGGATLALGITVITSTGSIPAFQVFGYLFP
jgi:hypothetical protein